MFSRLRSRRPRHGTVVAYLALFVAIPGGSAYAAATIGSAQVVDNSLQSVDLKDNGGVRTQDVINDTAIGGGLTGGDIRPNTLTGADIDESSLRGVDLWASVNSEGTINRSNGATSITGSGPDYTITFGRDVSRCAFTATLGNGSAAFVAPGSVQATNASSNKNAVAVRTLDHEGGLTSRSFFVVVHC